MMEAVGDVRACVRTRYGLGIHNTSVCLRSMLDSMTPQVTGV